MKIEDWAVERLNALEARPEMWAAGPEALDCHYTVMLEIILADRGEPTHQVREARGRLWDFATPLFAMPGMTFPKMLEHLKALRKEVLGG
jgi:hypothetical protein